MLCLLGEMNNDDTMYEKAWEISNHKYAKAMRMLGRSKLQKGENQIAINSFNTALSINKLYPQTWFSLGVAYMRTKEFSKASYAFGNVISLDPDTGDAWSNLASCNM